MGFWHTGYIEFHEEVGFGTDEYQAPTREYPCAACGTIFATAAALQQHRFESHPLRPPMLIVQGTQGRSRRMLITSKLEPADVHVEPCDRVLLNGQEIPADTLGHALAAQSSGTCRVFLTDGDATSEFTLEFRVASEDDLLGVEREFERIASKKRLDMRTVDDLIAATRQFETASGYSDGICAYLFGVLAKERATDCPLPYAKYSDKYEQGVDTLSGYDRPLARAIVSVIEFHHNHFAEAALRGGNSRIGQAARAYQRWLDARDGDATCVSERHSARDALEKWVTDRETEEIARWAVRPLRALANEATKMEAFLKRDVAEFDRVKVRILLSEMWASVGDMTQAIEHAMSLRHRSRFEQWAEMKIRVCSGRAR